MYLLTTVRNMRFKQAHGLVDARRRTSERFADHPAE